jgi:hypothetical protein
MPLMPIVPSQKFVAIQQVEGVQVASFMKLARPYTLEELQSLPTSEGAELPLDQEWMYAHGYHPDMTRTHCATSSIQAVEVTHIGVVLVKTQNSVYQVIPDFN